MKRDFREASILIAGATGVLGQELGRQFLKEGADLTLFGRDEARLTGLDFPGARIVGDLSDVKACERAITGAIGAHGRLDGIVNAAGVVAFGPFEEIQDETIEELMNANFLGPMRLVRAGLPDMERGGFIANLSAVVAEQPTAGMAMYSASKAALTALDHALARELRRRKIDIVDIRPPHTETGLADRPIAGEAPRLPEGRSPVEVAERIIRGLKAGEREISSGEF